MLEKWEDTNMMEFSSDLPECNYTQDVEPCHIGYTQGVASDGTPFVAELVRSDKQTNLAIVLPWDVPDYADGPDQCIDPADKPEVGEEIDQGDGVHASALLFDIGILDIGMGELGFEEDSDVIMDAVQKMEDLGLVEFNERGQNGLILYRVDVNGLEVAKVVITLEELGRIFGTTPLHFRDFPIRVAYKTQQGHSTGKIVQFPGKGKPTFR